jgi:formate/nitrite transporter FocA (FNT family)
MEGESELCRPVSALAWSGLAAGLSMGFSLVGQGLLQANLPHQSWSSIKFASIVAQAGVFPPELQTAFGEIGLRVIDGGFWITLLRAIFAGWLIALMVWLLPAAESSQLWVIVIITSLVGLGEFPHIIAGSVEVFYAVAIKAVSWSEYFGKFMIPTLIGNILGGVTLVAALNHAQVAQDDL